MAFESDLPTLPFADQRAWEAWLSKHVDSAGLWLKLAKRSAGAASVTYGEALEVALRYGWIDGQKKRFDESYWLQKFSPRGPGSIWSKNNRERAEQLIKEGRMAPSGLAAVNRARANGQWNRAYDSQKTAEPSADLRKALEARPRALAFFQSLDSRNRYAVLFRIHSAKKAETRAKRIEKFVDMLEKHQKIYR